jgi:predicted ATPase
MGKIPARQSGRGWLGPLLAMGYPEQALSQHLEGIARAREMGHRNTLAQTLYCGCVVRQLSRDRLGVVELAEALVPLATEHGVPYWLAMGTILRGWALSDAGETEHGITEMLRELTAFRATEAQLWVPYFLALLADGHGEADERAEELRLLAEAWTAWNELASTGSKLSCIGSGARRC